MFGENIKKVSKDNILRTCQGRLRAAKLLYSIAYRHLYSASNSVSQLEALSVHSSSRKKARMQGDDDLLTSV